ncbi:nucleotidyl transferase AbiEii/AbiGii toxin family protein [Deinococcus sp. D7000]|nr:nucleotidyl transferase AbiEii/AbiGii toxin family protein [Deinococcus sp. D7000]
MAALDRQHPRDLYDVRLLVAQGGLSRTTLLAFMVYLISHGRPLDEMLRPHFKNLEAEFTRAFVG